MFTKLVLNLFPRLFDVFLKFVNTSYSTFKNIFVQFLASSGCQTFDLEQILKATQTARSNPTLDFERPSTSALPNSPGKAIFCILFFLSLSLFLQLQSSSCKSVQRAKASEVPCEAVNYSTDDVLALCRVVLRGAVTDTNIYMRYIQFRERKSRGSEKNSENRKG